jgi:Tfp pilus assembly protein PilF
MTLLSQRQSAAALSEARASVGRVPESSVAQTVLALALIRATDREGARRALDQAIALDAGFAQAHAWRAFLLRAEGRLEEAETSARRAAGLAPLSSLARSALADALFAQGRTRDAREEARRAVALNPLSPAARVSLGRALLQDGEIERALEQANAAVALDPELERSRFLLGVVLAEQRRLGRAATELERAVALDPGYLDARAFLARVYLEQGREGEAVGVVREALARDPNFAPARAALGQVYWRAGRLREAAVEYRGAVETAPESVLHRLELARVYLDRNDMPNALEQGLKAVALAPGSSEAHAVLGLIYRRMDNREQATRELREAVSLSADNALARFELGFLTPNLTDARREIDQGLLRDPSVLAQAFKPGVKAEIAPAAGSDESYSLGFFHRDQFARGKLHDFAFATAERGHSYRDDRSQELQSAGVNLAAAPNHRTHVLGQYTYAAFDRPLPGPVDNPDVDARESSWNNGWDLASRYQVDARTHVWARVAHRVLHIGTQNPDSPFDGDPFASRRNRSSDLSAEGRLDHRWGDGHTTSYVFFAGRTDLDARFNLFDISSLDFVDVDLFGRFRTVTQTIQDDYRPSRRLSLVMGVTAERFAQNVEVAFPGGIPVTVEDEATTEWQPFGQLTYLLSRRDLVRVLAHERPRRTVDSSLQPAEAFLVGESPVLNLDGKTTNYELDFEHRFSPRVFAKLFLFRSDATDFVVAPVLAQSQNPVEFTVPRARSEGIGVRYEHQIGRFLSSYLRYTYRSLKDDTTLSTAGRQLPLNPRSRALLGFNYIDRAGTKLFLEADWRDEMFIDPIWSDSPAFDPAAPRETFPSKLVVNLRFGREPSVRREWVVSVNNVFDTDLIFWNGFPAPGRTFRVEYFIRF